MKRQRVGRSAIDIFELDVNWHDVAVDVGWELAAGALGKNARFAGLAQDEITLYHSDLERLGNMAEFVGALALVFAELEQVDAIVSDWTSTLDM